jgi:uncharacterized protein YggE
MSDPRTVTVTGHGTAAVVPDSAVVRVAVVHRAAGVADALAGVSAAAEQVVGVARDRNLLAGSTGINVWPWHDHQGKASGFEARHVLTVRCDGVEEAGSLLSALADDVADALVVEGVSLDVRDPSDARTAATEAAYDDARAHAAHLAALAGATLGEVVSLADTADTVAGGGPPVALAAAGRGAVLEPGETVVRSTVTVTWLLA